MEDVISKAAVSGLLGFRGSRGICLKNRMTGVNGKIIEGLIATLVELNDASEMEISRQASVLTLQADRQESIEDVQCIMLNPRR
jgi:hypothetical protein